MRFNEMLRKFQKDQRGITGLETAIILIAFVVVASVFAYTVLSAGIFSAERGKEAVHAGLAQARGTMEIVGGVIAKDTNGDGNVDQVSFTVANALQGESMDLAVTPDTQASGVLSDETGQVHTTIISYMDQNQRFDDVAWTKQQVGAGNNDDLLDPGEKMEITVSLIALDPELTAGGRFTLEVKPNRGSALVIERTIPPVVDPVMYLN